MTPEQFVETLRARGVEVTVKNNRLQLHPGVTWRTLTTDEAQCVSDHRAAIKLLVGGPKVEPESELRITEPVAITPKPEPEPEPVVWTTDYRRRITPQDLSDAGVVGRDRAAYERAREWLENQAREERTQRATGTMFESLRREQKGTHGGYRE